MKDTQPARVRLGVFELDLKSGELSAGDDKTLLPEQPLQILRMLIEREGELVNREEIRKRLWPNDTIVEFDHSINAAIRNLRKALGDSADEPQYIETLARRGYRLMVAVEGVTGEELFSPSPTLSPKDGEKGGAPASSRKWSSAVASVNRSKLAGLSLLLLLLAGVGGYLWRSRTRLPTAGENAASVAVLPFADMSPGKDQEYFSDGLAEELTNELAKIPGLKVTGRSSAFQFKGKNEDLRAVGQKLNVANILEGSVRRDGSRVRITAELTKAEDGFQLWSQEYNSELKDVFAVQDEIARAVTGALQVKLLGASPSPAAARSQGTNPEAYQAYLQAKYFLSRGTEADNFGKALAYADRAIKLDVNYSPAWALRSDVYARMASEVFDTDEGFRRARADAEQSIALDPNSAAGYLSLANVQINYELHWKDAEASLDKAAALQPGSAELLTLRASLEGMLGRLDEAIELQRQAIALDPLQPSAYIFLTQYLSYAGRYQDAIVPLQKAKELNPQHAYIHAVLGDILRAQGRPQDALAEIRLEPSAWAKLRSEAMTYHALGRHQAAEAALKELIAKGAKEGAFQIAEVYAYFGEGDKALDWLERAYQQHDSGLADLKVDPVFNNLHQNPRYIQLLEKMQLPL